MGVCTARVHGAAGGSQRVIDPHEISDLLPNDGNVIWLDIQDPTLGDLELLRREFGFHELALEDVAKQHQRAKVDQYDGYYFVVFYAIEPDTLREVNLFIGENYVVTIHRGELPAISETVERWQQNRDKLQHGIGLLVYSLMDAIVDGYFPVVDGIAERVDEIEQEIFRRASRESLEDVFALKKRLLSLRRILVPERDVMNVLARRDQPIFGEEVTVYFQDVYDHLLRVVESVDLYRDQLSSTLDAYLSMASNRLNETMKRMTAFATILMSVTLVASIYGINFEYMPELNWPLGYAWALGLMATVAGGLAAIFRKLDWY